MDSSQLTRHKRDRYTANALNGVPHPIYPLDEEKRIGYINGSKIVTYNKRTILPGCTGPTCNEDLLQEPQGTVVFDTMTTVLTTSNNIEYIAVDSVGNIYWVESTGPTTAYKIRKRDTLNIITDVFTFALVGGSPEYSQIVLDNNDNLYFFNYIAPYGVCLTKITPGGIVSHFTTAIVADEIDGVTINKENGDIYCVSSSACVIYKTNISGTTPIAIAGSGTVGYLDSLLPLSARFNEPNGIAFDTQNNYLYITELLNNDIRKIDLNTGIVSTYSSTAGNGSPTTGPTAGNTVNVDHTLSQFFTPQDIAIDSSGNLYICDTGNNRIKKIDSSGFVTLFAGDGSFGISNGPPLTLATFSLPVSIFIRSPTEMYVADSGNFEIRKITGSYQ
jgi:sugar lactone lactonase YvrE